VQSISASVGLDRAAGHGTDDATDADTLSTFRADDRGLSIFLASLVTIIIVPALVALRLLAGCARPWPTCPMNACRRRSASSPRKRARTASTTSGTYSPCAATTMDFQVTAPRIGIVDGRAEHGRRRLAGGGVEVAFNRAVLDSLDELDPA
jgi:hypothetical protein